MDSNNIKVAVRIRPQVPKELIDMCTVCTSVTPNEPQVWLGKDKAFTFDHVFDINSKQEDVYQSCVNELIEGCFEGFNATVLAYGQTGSGKTFTMGTGLEIGASASTKGIVPRAVDHLYEGIRERQLEAKAKNLPPPEFQINAQFLELYNEDINDLLAGEKTKHSQIKIREYSEGSMFLMGATTRQVSSAEECLELLKTGALSRTTGSTQMNSQSSRSHAIFTLLIKQHRVVPIDGEGGQEFETLTAKFHFVDLAGSERLKRTGATGDRAKEGISINSGLLALGNVISALGDKTKRASHVPYRDSKLTRLLQDSLGGNSRTLMIACISPSDRDFVETLNTLRYANRAKNIKNRVVANQDKSSQTINALRKQLQQLQLELMEYKQGKRLVGEDGNESINDMYHEINLLQTENENLKTRIKALQSTIEQLSSDKTKLVAEREASKWITPDGSKSTDIGQMVQTYITEIEELRTKLIECEAVCSQLRQQVSKSRNGMSPYSSVAIAGHFDIRTEDDPDCELLLQAAKKDVARLKKQVVNKDLFNNKGEKASEQQDSNGNELQAEDKASVNGDENEEETSTNEDSDSEEAIEDAEYAASSAIAQITAEITTKERLIAELEKGQRKLNTMKQHYEEKLCQLQEKISEIEAERDRVLAKLSALPHNQAETSKKSAEYQQRIQTMQTEMKKLLVAKREHEKVMKNSQQYENQMRQLKNELQDMRRNKVRLIAQMREEQIKHREAGLRYNKQIAQMSKKDRQKDVKIRKLESESNKFKQMLKRKDEEVNALKKRVKPMSDKVAGRVPAYSHKQDLIKQSMAFSPRQAKQKWNELEMGIKKLILNKQTLRSHENQFNRYVAERDHLTHTLSKTREKLERARNSHRPPEVMRELTELMEGYEEQIKYYNNNIKETQEVMVQLESNIEELEDMQNIVSEAKPAEFKYLFDKIVDVAVSQALLAAQKEDEKRSYEIQCQHLNDTSLVHEELLNHVMDTTFLDAEVLNGANGHAIANSAGGALENELRSHSPGVHLPVPESDFIQSPRQKREKARRLTRTTHELLFDSANFYNNSQAKDDPMTRSFMEQPDTHQSDLHRVPSAPSLKDRDLQRSLRLDASPSLTRKVYERNMQESRRLNKTTTNLSSAANATSSMSSSAYGSLSDQIEISETTPPASPSLTRRREENVFSRLTSGTAATNLAMPGRGHISTFTGRQSDKNSPLICTHVAEGHSRAVLSVHATNDVLFSGSKDCTVKIWDLNYGREIQSLTDHPDSVSVVRYNEYSRLAFSVCKSWIKVWDPRENPARCIKILNSSGLVSQTGSSIKSTDIQGECKIFDIRLSPYGTTLFSTSGNIVRFWDLRMYYCVGKLNTGHQANVICMAVEEAGVDTNIVITGSKDHYIKLFEVAEGIGGIHSPRSVLTPPHYDGIESLYIHNEFLFSASRDNCIKKWDLSNQRLVHSINQAHRDWVQALAVLPNSNTLISGCRQGFLRLWSTDTCQLVGDIKAHSQAINCIATNASQVFTAAGDNNIGIWTKRTSSEPSPDAE